MAVAAAVVLPAAAPSQDAASAVAGTPYASIVARNMFGLLPIPVHNPADDQPPADPPPKITPNGIMKLFGKYQALFKVANKPKPGQPAKEDAYVLAEGEMQDDIEVVKINNEDGIITFNNHGTVQELPLVAAKDAGGPPPPGNGPRFPLPGFPRPGMPMPNSPAFQGRFPRPGMGMNPNGVPQASTGGPVNGNEGLPQFQSAATPQQSQPNIEDAVMNTARQMAEIEQNRIATQEAVDKGQLPPLPPTMLTPQEATGIGGSPLTLPPMPGK